MKRMIVLIFFLVMLITGCGSEENVAVTTDTSEAESEVVSFQTKEGIFCSLVYTGDYEWRLLAQKDEQPDINDIGAAQSLALYMDEEFEMDIQDIDISEKEDILIVTCEDDTYVEISTGEEFFMKFYAPSGIEICYVNELFMDADGNMILGGMLEDEAVYGGGQRFDTVNKRGTEMTLYIGDHWNDSSATYMTIPLFTTSRGMGMYINRYEGITADFGKACEDEWKISLQNDKLDCYFYTSGDMKDALTGYAKLTGNADIPEEWSCGTLICRYSPDLTEFDMDVQKSNKDGAPAGKSVKTLVTSLIDSGMKPSAVIMEGWKWGDVFEDSYKARTDREKLQETVDWLHEQGISAMIYMRVGGKLERTMPGLSGEYLVHANVTANGHTTSTTSIPDVAGDGSNPDVSSDRHFYLDITNPDAVNWYFDEIWGQLIEIGIDGVKIDFCELFPDSDYDYNGTVITYDWYDNSKIEAGSEHHAYPTYFISAFYKRMNELKEEKGKDGSFMVLSRGGGIGSQRNPFLWAGDQVRAFDKLDDSILAVINSGLSGVPFMTYDMAGYRYGGNGVRYADEGSLEYESEVFARAIEFTAFTLNIQTHGTVRNIMNP